MRPKESHPGASPGVIIVFIEMEVIPGGTTAWMPL